MTTPTREQVVTWAHESTNGDLQPPVYESASGKIEFGIFHEEEMIQFSTLARADLAATVAEQAKEIERLKVESRDACFGLNEYYGLKLAASQSYAAQLRTTILKQGLQLHPDKTKNELKDEINRLFPHDDTALREYGAKLVERVSAYLLLNNATFEEIADKIRKGDFLLSAHQDNPTKPASSSL